MKMDNNCIIFDSKQSNHMNNFRISGKQLSIANSARKLEIALIHVIVFIQAFSGLYKLDKENSKDYYPSCLDYDDPDRYRPAVSDVIRNASEIGKLSMFHFPSFIQNRKE